MSTEIVVTIVSACATIIVAIIGAVVKLRVSVRRGELAHKIAVEKQRHEDSTDISAILTRIEVNTKQILDRVDIMEEWRSATVYRPKTETD